MPGGGRHAQGIGRKLGGPEQPQACIGLLSLSALVDLVAGDSEWELMKVCQQLLPQMSWEIWGRYVMPGSGNLHLATARDLELNVC